MTGTQHGNTGTASRPRTTWRERVIVLGGFAVAALYSSVAAILGAGMEAVGPLWLAAVVWTVPASLALALRRGFVHRDWSAFGDYELPDGREERFDWDTRSGRYAYRRIAEEQERLLLGN